MRDKSVALHPCQHLWPSVLWMLAVLTDAQWYHAALIFVSLVTRDCGTCFLLLTCHPNAFFGEVSVQVLVPFLIGLFVFLLFSFASSSCTLDTGPLSPCLLQMFLPVVV